jgi:hypothetical protein
MIVFGLCSSTATTTIDQWQLQPRQKFNAGSNKHIRPPNSIPNGSKLA